MRLRDLDRCMMRCDFSPMVCTMDIPRPDSSATINFILFPGHEEASVDMENPGAGRAGRAQRPATVDREAD